MDYIEKNLCDGTVCELASEAGMIENLPPLKELKRIHVLRYLLEYSYVNVIKGEIVPTRKGRTFLNRYDKELKRMGKIRICMRKALMQDMKCTLLGIEAARTNEFYFEHKEGFRVEAYMHDVGIITRLDLINGNIST